VKPKAITNRVIVSVIEDNEVTSGGVIMPFEERNSKFGRVLSVGPDVKSVHEGDKICFNSRVGVPQEVMGEDYLFMKECDVLGVVIE
jgi:co-chaperonin GroES (HSP10)